ncbi:MAG: hypothetical protein R2873_24760 [Caldilineaceae bacterium]
MGAVAAITNSGANQLKVRREGSLILLFVNDVFGGVVSDNSLSGGYTGIANWAGYTSPTGAVFCSFELNRIQQVYAEPYSVTGSGWLEGSIEVCQAAYLDGEYVTAAQADYLCYYRAPSMPQTNGRFSVAARNEEGFYAVVRAFLRWQRQLRQPIRLLRHSRCAAFCAVQVHQEQWLAVFHLRQRGRFHMAVQRVDQCRAQCE